MPIENCGSPKGARQESTVLEQNQGLRVMGQAGSPCDRVWWGFWSLSTSHAPTVPGGYAVFSCS